VYGLVRVGGGYRLAQVRVDRRGDRRGPRCRSHEEHLSDPSRRNRRRGSRPASDPDGRRARLWTALGLRLTSADLVGLMRGVLELAVAYGGRAPTIRVPVGSFEAVQHLLADAHCLMEGSISVALHASWAVDDLPPADARTAGRVAKAYCARAARDVCETAVQVHGGIGNTWECLVHVFLRRALLSSQWFGDDGEQLRQLERERLGTVDGLP